MRCGMGVSGMVWFSHGQASSIPVLHRTSFRNFSVWRVHVLNYPALERYHWICRYSITELNGCTPYDDSTDYLIQGIRSRTFHILQTTNFVSASLMMGSLAALIFDDPVDRGHPDDRGKFSKFIAFMGGGLIVYEIIYLGIICCKGSTAIISGNCLLVELCPWFGLFDSEISHWWKNLMAVTGLWDGLASRRKLLDSRVGTVVASRAYTLVCIVHYRRHIDSKTYSLTNLYCVRLETY